MNEQETAKKITGYLDRGTAGLKAGTAFKLQRARQHALARLSAPQQAPEFALAGAGGATFGGRRYFADARIWTGDSRLGSSAPSPDRCRPAGDRFCELAGRSRRSRAARSLMGRALPLRE